MREGSCGPERWPPQATASFGTGATSRSGSSSGTWRSMPISSPSSSTARMRLSTGIVGMWLPPSTFEMKEWDVSTRLATSCWVRFRPGVLLESVEQHDEIARALIENPIARVGEPDPQLTQLPLDLRGDRVLRRRGFWRPAAQVRLDVVVDLGGPLRRQLVDEPVDWFDPPLVAVVDSFCLRHPPSMAGVSAAFRPAISPPPPSRG